jgi:hypothetical protein
MSPERHRRTQAEDAMLDLAADNLAAFMQTVEANRQRGNPELDDQTGMCALLAAWLERGFALHGPMWTTGVVNGAIEGVLNLARQRGIAMPTGPVQ